MQPKALAERKILEKLDRSLGLAGGAEGDGEGGGAAARQGDGSVVWQRNGDVVEEEEDDGWTVAV